MYIPPLACVHLKDHIWSADTQHLWSRKRKSRISPSVGSVTDKTLSVPHKVLTLSISSHLYIYHGEYNDGRWTGSGCNIYLWSMWRAVVGLDNLNDSHFPFNCPFQFLQNMAMTLKCQVLSFWSLSLQWSWIGIQTFFHTLIRNHTKLTFYCMKLMKWVDHYHLLMY